jgi:multidrug efflux pump subunit AcrA (membrane-fusion protein)
MSDVERIFDRFIDAFADDLLEIAREFIDGEVSRALLVAERAQSVADRAEAKAARSTAKLTAKQKKAEQRAQKRAARLAKKAAEKAAKQQQREARRAARLAEKERLKAERLAEKERRQVEHDRLKQERLALKQELEAERRRLREATRKRPVRQLPLDFDGLRTPKARRRDVPVPGTPPPLFVHKRKRDGQIEKLARTDEPPTATTPDAVPPPAGVTNGAATHSNGLASTPVEAAPAE